MTSNSGRVRTFAPQPTSVGEARAFVSAVLDASGVTSPAITEAVVLTVSELATNAVLHADTDFEVAVEISDSVHLSVTDRDPRPPRQRPPDEGRPGGRGLTIVDALTAEWGCEEVRGGKRVWCVIPLEDVRGR